MNLLKYLTERFPNGGYYVEAGAHDGIGDSQTYALEQTGKWDGLCVEPSSAYGRLRKSRQCEVDCRCLYGSNGTVVFREVLGNAIELSGIPSCFNDDWDRTNRPHEHRQVESVTLTDLLCQHEAPSMIEFLCLDTEGSELSILAAHDFDMFRIMFIAVEHNGVEVKRRALLNILEREGYKLLEDDGINLFMEYAP